MVLGRAYWVDSSRGRETAVEFGCSMVSGGWRSISLGGSEREKSNYMSWALVAVGRLFQRTKVLAPGKRTEKWGRGSKRTKEVKSSGRRRGGDWW